MAQIPFKFYGGIEGGATNTKFVLVRSDGKILSTSSCGGSNPYLIGLDECLKLLSSVVKEGLKTADLPEDTVLEGLGMSISGGDEKPTQEKIKIKMKENYPFLTKHTFIGSDTQSAIATALPKGGVVLIAGTGSNCQVMNSDGSMARCGGWGHLIGDESSACWISLRAVKIYFDHEDQMFPCHHSVTAVRDAIFSYFKINTRGELLDSLYGNFNKSHFAGLCKDLAQVALKTADPLICEIFAESGRYLARHLYGVSGKLEQDMKTKAGGVPVVCVGSVFKSWKLLEPGFVKEMRANLSDTGIQEVSFYQLKTDATIGAAALGAKAAGIELPIDYENNASIFYQQKFSSNK